VVVVELVAMTVTCYNEKAMLRVVSGAVSSLLVEFLISYIVLYFVGIKQISYQSRIG